LAGVCDLVSGHLCVGAQLALTIAIEFLLVILQRCRDALVLPIRGVVV
jgi:cytochrome P450